MKRILTLLLALLMVLSCALVSCGDDETESNKPDESETKAGSNETETETEPETEPAPAVAEGYASGKTIKILRFNPETWRGYNYDLDWHIDVPGDDVVSRAVYAANVASAKYLGATDIKWEVMTIDVMQETVTNSVKANNGKWDLIVISQSKLSNFAINGLLNDWNSQANVNLDNPWWNQDLRNCAAVNGRFYHLSGKGSISTYKNMWRIYINEDMIAEKNLTSPYDLVDAHKWTLDKVYEYERLGSFDEGGDNVWVRGTDILGMIYLHFAYIPAWIYGAGLTFTYYDDNADTIKLTEMTSSKWDNVDRKLIDMMSWYNGISYGNAGSILFADASNGINFFINEKAMMAMEDARNLDKVRNAKFNWGCVPMPLYDDEQENYCTLPSEDPGYFCLPIDGNSALGAAYVDVDQCYGMEYVLDAYVGDVMYTKAATTEQAARMYDIMIEGITLDFCQLFNDQFYYDGGLQPGQNSPHWRIRAHIVNFREDSWSTYWNTVRAPYEEGLAELQKILGALTH